MRIVKYTLVVFWLLSFRSFAQPDTLTILHLNDTHSNLAPLGPRNEALEGSQGGLARAASAIGFQKATNPNPVLLHAGDLFVGDLFFNVYFGVPELQILRDLGFSALAVGNHEFDLTPSTLHSALQAAFADSGFPLLSANLILDDPAVDSLKDFIRPFTVIEIGGINVGVFGMTTPATNQISLPAPAVVDTNIIEIATAMVDTLKALGCDVILCLSHMGFTLDVLMATYVPGIHGVVGGHDHYLFNEPRIVENVAGDSTWIVQVGSYYLALGKLRLIVESQNVRILDYEVIQIEDPIPQEETIAGVVDQLTQGIETAYGQPFYTQHVGVVGEYLEEFDENPLAYGMKDTPLGNFIADVYREFSGADIAIQPNGSIAQPLYAGPIVAADLYRAVGYGFNTDNFLGYRFATFDITGVALCQGLEFSLSTLHINDDFLIQVSGMSYVYDPAKPAFERLVSVKIGGNPVDPLASYRVATNEFVALFLDFLGIPIDSLKIYEGVSEFEVLLQNVASLDTIQAASEGRVRADSIDRTTSVAEGQYAIPKEFALQQNYPNPFNPSTTIEFSVPVRGFVTLKVYNLLGQEVATLVSEELQPGVYKRKWNAPGLSSGVYFYRLQGSEFAQTKRLIMVK